MQARGAGPGLWRLPALLLLGLLWRTAGDLVSQSLGTTGISLPRIASEPHVAHIFFLKIFFFFHLRKMKMFTG